MYKKLITSCIALAAFIAFGAAATSASAKPVITHPTGTILAAGATVTATNVGNIVFATPLGNVTCDHADMHGTVHSNTTAAGFKVEITAASFNGTGSSTDCTGPGAGESTKVTPTGLPWCRESTAAADTFTIRGGKCTEAAKNLTFTFDLTNGTQCTYSRASIDGTFTTDITVETEQSSESNSKFSKSGGGFLCPSEIDISGTFAWETTNGTPLYASS